MKKYLFLIVVLAMVLSICAFAAETKDAKQLMNSLYSSKGEPIRDAIMDADVFIDIKETPFSASKTRVKAAENKMYFLAPNKFRIDIVNAVPNLPISGTTKTIIRDGKYTYTFVAYGDAPAKIDIDKPGSTGYLPFFLQKYPIYDDFKYFYLGQEKIDGQMLDVVALINPASYVDYNDNMVRVWINTEKQIPVKIEYSKYKDKDKKETYNVRIKYQDLRQLPDGRWWPFKVLIEEANKDTDWIFKFSNVAIFKRAAVNVGLEESLFKPIK